MIREGKTIKIDFEIISIYFFTRLPGIWKRTNLYTPDNG